MKSKPCQTNQMNRFVWALVVFALVISACQPVGLPNEDLSAGFSTPEQPYRPGAFWCWLNGNMTPERISRDLREMSEKGMGRAEIWDVAAIYNPDNYIPAGPQFLSDSSVALMKHAFAEGEKYGIEIGMVGSSGWNAGGTWVEPEWASKQLYFSEMALAGPVSGLIELPFPEVPAACPKGVDGLPVFYREVAVLALPASENKNLSSVEEVKVLSGEIQGNRLLVELPAGDWVLMRLINSNNGQQLIVPSPKSKGLFIDFLDPESTKKHLGHILNRLGVNKGVIRTGGLAYVEFDSMELAEGIPWTDQMPSVFQSLRGYDLTAYLPVLAGWNVGPDTERFLYDWKKAVSDQLIHSHYETGREFLSEYGVKLVAEAGGPGPPTWSTCPVDALKALGSVTVPRGEFWVQHRHIFLVKEVASASHIYGRQVVDAESFTTWRRWKDSPFSLKKIVDRAFCEGLNMVTFHTFASTAPEDGYPGRVYHAGSDINLSNTWWEKSGPFMDYLSRCSYLLQQGLFVADACYFYGDQAPNFWPAWHVVPEKIIPEDLGQGYDYDVVNSDVILNRMTVKEGRLVLPDGLSYQVMVLPDQEDMPLAVLEKIEQLVLDGATIVGPKPTKVPNLYNYEEDDRALTQIADRLWDDASFKDQVYSTVPVRQVLTEKGTDPDFLFDEPGELDYIHRSSASQEIYFIRNKSAEPYSGKCSFRVRKLNPELWDPVSGESYCIHDYEQGKKRTSLPLRLDAFGSVFIVFQKEKRDLPAIEDLQQPVEVINTLEGNWKLTFTEGWGAPDSVSFPKLMSWTESENQGVKYYSGTAAYHKAFVLDASELKDSEVFIDLGKVADVAEVFVNGQSAGIVWNPPYQLNISELVKAGENQLRIEVVNQWVNRLTGDMLAAPEDRFCKTNMPYVTADDFGVDNWKEGGDETYRLQDAGLLGPVRIVRSSILN